jgi:hypothetical protein
MMVAERNLSFGAGQADPGLGEKASAEDARFDRWLSRRLHEAYDNILKEELPPDLAVLIEALGQRGSGEAPAPYPPPVAGAESAQLN